MIRRPSASGFPAVPTVVLSRALALGLALSPLLAPAAGATAPRRGPCCVYITVESRYGTGTVTAAVRQGPSGRLEVRLPGGTWIECRQSCHDTLRRETVDFWQNHGPPRSGGDGPGYLHFEF
jgi:hypothetical protein